MMNVFLYIYFFKEENSKSDFEPVNIPQGEVKKVTLVIWGYEPDSDSTVAPTSCSIHSCTFNLLYVSPLVYFPTCTFHFFYLPPMVQSTS